MAKDTGEYSSPRGTPVRKGTGKKAESKQLTSAELARVSRIAAQETGPHPETGLDEKSPSRKRAALRTNNYSEEVEFGEEV